MAFWVEFPAFRLSTQDFHLGKTFGCRTKPPMYRKTIGQFWLALWRRWLSATQDISQHWQKMGIDPACTGKLLLDFSPPSHLCTGKLFGGDDGLPFRHGSFFRIHRFDQLVQENFVAGLLGELMGELFDGGNLPLNIISTRRANRCFSDKIFDIFASQPCVKDF
jgi:hypothetical protein